MKKILIVTTLAMTLLTTTAVFAASEKTYNMMGQTITQSEYDEMLGYMNNDDYEGMNQFMIDTFGFSMNRTNVSNGENFDGSNNAFDCFNNNSGNYSNNRSSNNGRGCH